MRDIPPRVSEEQLLLSTSIIYTKKRICPQQYLYFQFFIPEIKYINLNLTTSNTLKTI